MVRFRIAAALLLALGLLAANAGLAREDKDKDKKSDNVKSKLIGVWEVTKSELPVGSTIEFTKEGKIKLIRATKRETEVPDIFLGTWSLPNNTDLKVSVTMRDGRDKQSTLKIVELTDTKLVTKDELNMVDELKKVPEKK